MIDSEQRSKTLERTISLSYREILTADALFRKNPCYMTKEAAFEVSEKVLKVMRQFPNEQISDISTVISKKLQGALNEEFLSGTYNRKDLCSVPVFVEYITRIAKMDLQLSLRHSTSSSDMQTKVQALLASEIYEVRLVILDTLITLYNENKTYMKASPQPENNSTDIANMEQVTSSAATERVMSSAATEFVMSLLPYLLNMALYKEQHFECQIQVEYSLITDGADNCRKSCIVYNVDPYDILWKIL